MAHAQATDGIKTAIRGGIRSIEHGIYLDDEAIEMMVEHHRGAIQMAQTQLDEGANPEALDLAEKVSGRRPTGYVAPGVAAAAAAPQASIPTGGLPGSAISQKPSPPIPFMWG